MSLKANLFTLALFLLTTASNVEAKCRCPHDCNPTAISDSDICNFHKVDNDLYRGAHPTCRGLTKLQELGIRTFVNLGSAESAIHGCEDEAKNSGVRFISFPISAVQTAFMPVRSLPRKQLTNIGFGASRIARNCLSRRQ